MVSLRKLGLVLVLVPGVAMAQHPVPVVDAPPATASLIEAEAPVPTPEEELSVNERLRLIQERRRGLMSRETAVTVNTVVGGIEVIVAVPAVVLYRRSFRNFSDPRDYLGNQNRSDIRLGAGIRENTPGLLPAEASRIIENFNRTIHPPIMHTFTAPVWEAMGRQTHPNYNRGRLIELELNNNHLRVAGVAVQTSQNFPDYAFNAIRNLTEEQVAEFNRYAENWMREDAASSRLHSFFEPGTREYAFFKGLEDARRGHPDISQGIDPTSNTRFYDNRIPAQYALDYRLGRAMLADPNHARVTIYRDTIRERVTGGVAEEVLRQELIRAVGDRTVVRVGTVHRLLNRAQMVGLLAVLGNGFGNLYTAYGQISSGALADDPHGDFCGQAYCTEYNGPIRYPSTVGSTSGALEMLHSLTVRQSPSPEAPPAASRPAN